MENETQRKIQWSQMKDKRISFLSIFSSLCNLSQHKTAMKNEL